MQNNDITYLPQQQIQTNTLSICSPFSGKVLPLSEHPEPFFSYGTVGPGIMVELTSHKILSPFDGILLQVKNAGCEFILQAKNGLKVLINLHLDKQLDIHHTHIAQLNGSKIAKGQRLAYFDLRDLNTPLLASLILLNGHQLKPMYFSLSHVTAGTDTLLTLTKK
ncbi:MULTISPECIES: PTS glucose transporter subunit IIA [unclassified Pseudoalteromonas]|uniref:PTS glucose transporter subunit IIA n=1 Tax=unclassified Pseudoalteromonas TaxID=194690 RepID=UPI000B3CA4CE|nr:MULTISPECIES: PTS glucose transporter subunit IIA [unclassified Pseudoalteromonas]MDN3377349.1 PTS glucose transporter subunit IIA [Pseudoalteromonas sp. APC 3893]MDN3385483.1 PTS glucose transporter subunit IIA [Pseudoalteromonas sp. APC 4017]OUS68349.1 PTS sugar transporter [Pseudoalteromonas sp. A601]